MLLYLTRRQIIVVSDSGPLMAPYTACSKKASHMMSDKKHFGKCGPIFKILLPDNS